MIQHNQTFLSKDDMDRVLAQLENGMINDSDVSREFEEKFKNYTAGNHAYATGTGTLAICKALRSIGVSEGDVVITTTYTCKDVYDAVKYTGAALRPVDIDSDDFNLDANEVLNKIDSSVKAIIVPHMFGVPADIEKLKDTGIYLIEDCAWSLGSKLDGRYVGTIGDFGTFSFHALKGIVTGEGGMLLSKKPIDAYPGYKKNPHGLSVPYHLSNLLATLGISQLSRIDTILQKRKEIAARYNELLSGDRLKTPVWKRGDGALLRYCVQLPDGLSVEKVMQLMKERGVIVQRPVKSLLHLYEGLKNYKKAEDVFNRTISLPAHLHITEVDQIKVTNELINILKKHA